MKRMSIVVMVAIAALLSGYAMAGDLPIVIIGGAGSTLEQLEPLHQALSGSVVIIPKKYYPLSSAAAVVLEQIREEGIKGSFVAVGWSWGALIAHQINERNEGLVVAIVAIASPLDVKYVPSFLGAPFNPKDKGPLYVIAGVKPSAPQKWYMTSESDGIVDIDEANGFGKCDLKGFAIIRGENAGHWDVIQHPETIRQTKEWMEKIHDRKPVFTALSVR